jgi:Ni/Co efflux regulator RcnB
MKKLVIGVFAAALVAAPAAFADNHQDDGHHSQSKMMSGPAHYDSGMSAPTGDMHRNDHAMMPHHNWRHGDRLPEQYRHYAGIDWRAHHLRRPPHGYHWVRVDDDYVLVAVATGIVLETVFASH